MARVLAIDDDLDILAVVEGALEIGGHLVVTSSEPETAIDLAVEHDIEVIVLDVNMPGLSGFETLEALRADPRTTDLPILFLSALGDSKHRIRGLRSGADDYLAKPFEPDELALRVERLLARLHRAGLTQGSDPERVEDALSSGVFRPGALYFGRYQALEMLAEGAMGVVFRGWDPRLKRPVALKTLRLGGLADQVDSRPALSHLIHEASTLARFSHPNIVAVYDAGSANEIAFIVMELVDGISLQLQLLLGPLSPAQTVKLGSAIASALASAHDHGIVHRDIKPGNILLGHGGVVKVSDFGLADLVTSLNTDSRRIFGTPGYVPPESFLSEAHTPAGDLFSLGAVLYKCVTGSPAFTGADERELLTNNLLAEVTSPLDARAEIPVDMSRLVVSLLSRDPAARPSAGETLERLDVIGSLSEKQSEGHGARVESETYWNIEEARELDEQDNQTTGPTEPARLIDTRDLLGTQ